MNKANDQAEPGIIPLDFGLPFNRRRVAFSSARRNDSAPAALVREEPEISIIAPLHNESPNVLPLAEQILEAFREENRKLEVILVDDASSDDTWARILEAQRRDGRVRGLRHLEPGGQSAALWTGFAASRGEIVATLDGDLQNDPADLPQMVRELATFDLICGVRARRMDSPVRRISSGVARWARKQALGVDFQDIGCNLRALKRPVLSTLLPFDALHRFIPVLAQDAGALVKEIPVKHHPRVAGRSKYGVWNRLGRGMWDLAMVCWYRKRQLRNIAVVEHARPPALPFWNPFNAARSFCAGNKWIPPGCRRNCC